MSSSELQFGAHSFPSGVPSLLLQLDPWHRVFLANLRDLVLRRQPKPVEAGSEVAPFWSDVFVPSRIPWMTVRQSLLYHLFVLTAIWGFSQTYFLRPPVVIEKPTRNTTLTYYQVSEYLPPILSAPKPAKLVQRGQPAYSKQPIISAPANPDNNHQTIVNPKAPGLIKHDVKLPNLVVSTAVPAPPMAGAGRSASQLTLPWVAAAAPVPPAAENISRRVSEVQLQGRAPSVVQPAPEVEAVQRKIGDISVAQIQPQVEAPKLPIPEQRATSGQRQSAVNVPHPPPASVGGAEGQSAGQLIALNLEPTPPAGPIEVPVGNRRGSFAATPSGKPAAPGTPDRNAGAASAGGGGNGSAATNNSAGLYVGDSGIRAADVRSAPPAKTFAEAQRSVIIAAARPAPDIPRATPGANLPRTPKPGSVEQEIFGPRKYYSMVLNMPNLTSAAGTWIIRFAELKQGTEAGELTAPVAIHKVDPAYPPALMHAHVEGTVMLYAIIRADGTVDSIKVLRGVDDTLDANAQAALSRWHFRPATHRGVPVDLEAVVQIPFATRRLPF